MDKKLLIIFVCFLIVTLVPASAVETSSIISKKTDDIKEDQASIINETNKLSETSNSINGHVKVIQDTIEGMNHVKWYQFWKWDFYIRQGPNRILKESKFVELLSKDVGCAAATVEENVNSTAITGNKSLQIGLDKANQITEPNTLSNNYNVGIASINANLIADKLSSRYQKNYTATEKGALLNGDIVQYRLSHNNYVYLQYVGLNPSGDTVLLLGDFNTAVRLPVSGLKNIKYKISESSNSNTRMDKPENSLLNFNNSTQKSLTNIFNPQSSFSMAAVHYIANVQADGLKVYKDTNIADYNERIDNQKDTRNTGKILMIAGGVIGGVGASMLTVVFVIAGVAGVKIMMGILIPALFGSAALDLATVGILVILSSALTLIGTTLLATGGGIYASADYALEGINGNKFTFLDGCNAIENDLNTYNSGVSNNLPSAQDIYIDVEQNSRITCTLNATDADGDELIYSNVNQPLNGTLTKKNNGTYIYIPRKGFAGNDSFEFIANDVYGDSNIAIVHIIVHPVNHAPVSTNMFFDIETNNKLTAQLKAIDKDGDSIIYNLLNSTSNGNITINNDGTFNYTPKDGFLGNDSFTYTTKDWKDNGTTATVQINVHPVNHLPVTGDLNFTLAKNENITGLLNATDSDGDNLTYKLINSPVKGTITLDNNGTFTYIPRKNMVGSDTFTYKSNDWQGESNLGTVNIEVYQFNHPPVANNINIKTLSNHPFKGLFNATDLDDDELTYKIMKKPIHGTLNLLSSGLYIYTPINGFEGNDSFTYKANDGKNQSNIATIKISLLRALPRLGYRTAISNIPNTPNKATQIKQSLKSQIINTPNTQNTQNMIQGEKQPLTPQTLNATDLYTIPEKSPVNDLLTLITAIKNTINQIKEQITSLLSEIGVNF
jgi:hypothetical protein